MDNLWTSRSPGPGQLKLPTSDEEYQISGVFVSGAVGSPGRAPGLPDTDEWLISAILFLRVNGIAPR